MSTSRTILSTSMLLLAISPVAAEPTNDAAALAKALVREPTPLQATQASLVNAADTSGVLLAPGRQRAMTVLRGLADSAGVDLSITVGGECDVTAVDGTFWQAMMSLCRNNNWDVALDAGGHRNLGMTVVQADPSRRQLSGIASETGPGLVLLRSVVRTAKIDLTTVSGGDLAEQAADEQVTYAFDVLLEPRFQIGPREFAIVWTRATDGDGRSLLPVGVPSSPAVDSQAVVDAAGDLDGAAPPRQPIHVAAATWSAGRMRSELALSPPQTQPSAAGITLVGSVEGLVGANLITALQPEGAPGLWLVAGEPLDVRLVSGAPDNGRATFHLQVRGGRPVDDDVRRLITDSLDGARVTVGGVPVRRGATRRRDDSGFGLDIVFVAGAGTVGEAVASCEVPSHALWLSLPFRFDGVPMP